MYDMSVLSVGMLIGCDELTTRKQVKILCGAAAVNGWVSHPGLIRGSLLRVVFGPLGEESHWEPCSWEGRRTQSHSWLSP